MFVRLRDLAHFMYRDQTQFYLDKRNYNIHWECELYYFKLPNSVTDNLVKIPKMYMEEDIYEIVSLFVEKEIDNYPELKSIFLSTEKKHRVCKTLGYVDFHQLWGIYDEFAEKHIISKLKKWCKSQNISYGM